VAALEARTEGWIAGLQLAALSLQGRPPDGIAPFVAAFAGSHRYVVDYLVDEVLLRQPEEVQRFLLHTCILELLCAPLCVAVIEGENLPAARVSAPPETASEIGTGGVAGGQAMLERLERSNVFLIALDDERRWYRYHHLFAEALRQRQRPAVPDVSLLHRRASLWLEKEGLLQDAVAHALAAAAYDRAADLMTRVAPPLFARGEFNTLAAWFQALPAPVLQTRPQLCFMRAWLYLDVRDLDAAEQCLQQAEAVLDTCSPDEARHLRESRE
jgi:LuxR family maltose regulon positive regulatory protein